MAAVREELGAIVIDYNSAVAKEHASGVNGLMGGAYTDADHVLSFLNQVQQVRPPRGGGQGWL